VGDESSSGELSSFEGQNVIQRKNGRLKGIFVLDLHVTKFSNASHWVESIIIITRDYFNCAKAY
jgi:hypothetical protein